MPLIRSSSYSPPPLLRNRHLQTILPAVLRRVAGVTYSRQRLHTPDNDFIDLDWSYLGSNRVAVILHGLEGNSRRPYIRGMVRACNLAGWDAVAVNMRGCSGTPNCLARCYHNGSSDDLALVINHVASRPYTALRCIGFSLGGNVLLKYLGEQCWTYPDTLTSAVVISPPCHVAGCAEKLANPCNAFYMKRFLRMLHRKISSKKKRFPKELDDSNFDSISTFREFDNRYTAPLHGFTSAEDYWAKASSLQYIPAITLPTLIISAADDPFLSKESYPISIAESHPAVTLELPVFGGHCGFIELRRDGYFWHERRAIEFLRDSAIGSTYKTPT